MMPVLPKLVSSPAPRRSTSTTPWPRFCKRFCKLSAVDTPTMPAPSTITSLPAMKPSLCRPSWECTNAPGAAHRLAHVSPIGQNSPHRPRQTGGNRQAASGSPGRRRRALGRRHGRFHLAIVPLQAERRQQANGRQPRHCQIGPGTIVGVERAHQQRRGAEQDAGADGGIERLGTAGLAFGNGSRHEVDGADVAGAKGDAVQGLQAKQQPQRRIEGHDRPTQDGDGRGDDQDGNWTGATDGSRRAEKHQDFGDHPDGPEQAGTGRRNAERTPVQGAKGIKGGMCRLDGPGRQQEGDKAAGAQQLSQLAPAQYAAALTQPGGRRGEGVGGNEQQRRARDQQGEQRRRLGVRHQPTACQGGGREADGAPQARPAVIEPQGAHAADGDGFRQGRNAGPGQGQQQGGEQNRPEASRLRQQQLAQQRQPGQDDEIAAMIAAAIGEEGNAGRHQHPHEQGTGADAGDLAGCEANPVEPDRQIGKIAAGDAEYAGEQGGNANRKGAALSLDGGEAHAARGWSWMISANSEGSTLPPDKTAATVRPLRAILPARIAANDTAPPGSTTSFSSRKAKRTAALASASLTARPPARCRRATSKVISPGVAASKASQMEPDSATLRSRWPFLSERARSSKPAGSTLQISVAGCFSLTAIATPLIRPPPEAPTSTRSGVAPIAAACSSISRPTVPWPAITSLSSKGCT